MKETVHADLLELARCFRSVLSERSQRRPDKSPFILLYAFNGTGKTRLSSAFKGLGSVARENEVQDRDTLYFNAFTEDLFLWDNDLENDEHRVLKLKRGVELLRRPQRVGDREPDSAVARPLRGLRLQDHLRVR